MKARDDSGASLVMALIFVTVVAVVIGAVLSFADVNFRTATQLRLQSEDAAAADGAGQIAVNALRRSLYAGTGDCLGPSNTLKLNQFYDRTAGAKTSAAVTCELDTDLTVSDGGIPISNANKSPKAILNVSSFGTLRFDPNGRRIGVNGSVYANGSIDVSPSGDVRATGAVGARFGCDDDIQGTPRDCVNPFSPEFSYTHYANPNPQGPTNTPSLPSCSGSGSFRLLNFQPGRYTSSMLTTLNTLTKPSGPGNCNSAIFAFAAGNYYFDFDGVWNIQTGYVVAGDGVNLVGGTEPKIPGSCKVPAPPNPVPTGGFVAQNPAAPAGATFLLGRQARIKVSNGANFEICGPYSATRPPIAIFGVENSISGVIADQDGCITAGTCNAIETEGNADFVVQGMVYLPQAEVDITVNSPRVQTISAGIIARSLTMRSNGTISYPMAQLPDNSAGVGQRIVVYLKVFVCPGAATCDATGTLRLDAKVALTYAPGSTGTPGVTVLSWNVRR